MRDRPIPPMPPERKDGRNIVLHHVENQSAACIGLIAIDEGDLPAVAAHALLAQGWGVVATSPEEWEHFHRTFPAPEPERTREPMPNRPTLEQRVNSLEVRLAYLEGVLWEFRAILNDACEDDTA